MVDRKGKRERERKNVIMGDGVRVYVSQKVRERDRGER